MASPIVAGRHFGVEALYNLARFAASHLRSIAPPGLARQGSIRSPSTRGRYPFLGFAPAGAPSTSAPRQGDGGLAYAGGGLISTCRTWKEMSSFWFGRP
jgi:hypothetical protein